MALTWAACYERHFQHFFGKPYDLHVYRAGDGAAFRVATFDQAYKEFRLYASLGLADLLPEGREAGEVILVADDFGPDVPFLFANALTFLLKNDIPLDGRVTIGGVEALRPAFAEFYDKAALYFMRADGFADGFNDVECGADAGAVFQAVFVSDEEQDYIADKGGEAFENKVKAQHADLCRLRRLSCV